MRLVAFTRRGEDEGGAESAENAESAARRGGVGVLTDDGIYDLTRAALYWNADPDRPVLRHLVRDVSLLILAGPEKLQTALDLLSGGGGGEGLETSFPLIPLESVDLRAPLLRPPKIVGVGLNYLDHCREQGVFPPDRPLLFAKFANAVTDPGAPVAHPEWTQQLDFECELGVVIGSTASRVSVDGAMAHVFGYTILNDVTARDAQKSDRQWLRAKGADGFAPLGPVIVTADEVPDPQKLGIGSTVNGELRQYSSTSEMVFGVAQLISYISQSITLEPGDVIATGTPAGVGHYMKPPRYLEPGDVIRCEIEGLGVLENEIVERPALPVATVTSDAVAAAPAWVGEDREEDRDRDRQAEREAPGREIAASADDTAGESAAVVEETEATADATAPGDVDHAPAATAGDVGDEVAPAAEREMPGGAPVAMDVGEDVPDGVAPAVSEQELAPLDGDGVRADGDAAGESARPDGDGFAETEPVTALDEEAERTRVTS